MARVIWLLRRRLVIVVAVLDRWVVNRDPTVIWRDRLHRDVLLGIVVLVRALIMNCPHGNLIGGLLAWLPLPEVRRIHLLALLKPLLMLDVGIFISHEWGSHNIQILN
jgi:hypothetical protein